jgi:phosphonate transport system ATP-binding protein
VTAGQRDGAAGVSLAGVGVRLGGRPVLAGVDLEVGPGEAVALVGPSGAGKTTLLRVVSGTVRPDGGDVAVDGQSLGDLDAAGLRALRARIGFIHQDLRLVPNLRVVQNVLSGGLGRRSFAATLRLMLRPAQADLLEAHRLLERVGIAEKLYERTDRLSGGQAQRVAVARALFQQPAVLLADEPVASVDPARARATLELLTGICREAGLTLMVSLHDPALVREFFPRAVGLRQGRVVFDRPAAALDPRELRELYRLEQDDAS